MTVKMQYFSYHRAVVLLVLVFVCSVRIVESKSVMPITASQSHLETYRDMYKTNQVEQDEYSSSALSQLRAVLMFSARSTLALIVWVLMILAFCFSCLIFVWVTRFLPGSRLRDQYTAFPNTPQAPSPSTSGTTGGYSGSGSSLDESAEEMSCGTSASSSASAGSSGSGTRQGSSANSASASTSADATSAGKSEPFPNIEIATNSSNTNSSSGLPKACISRARVSPPIPFTFLL